MAACTCADPQLVAKSIDNQTDKLEKQLKAIHETLYGASCKEDPHSGGSIVEAAKNVVGAATGGITGRSALTTAKAAISKVAKAKAAVKCEGSQGMFSPIRFAHWLAPEVSGDSQQVWNNALNAARLAIAVANAYAQGKIADKNQELAEAYYDMAQYKLDRFKSAYMPLEKQLLKEVSSTELRSMDCASDRNRAVNAVDTAYTLASSMIKRNATKYRVCIDPSMASMLDFHRSTMIVDTENYNISDDRWFTDYKNDQRWDRRSNVLSLGRNLTSLALSYGETARALMKGVGKQIGEAAGSLMYSIGYFGGRNDTVYPTTFMGSHGNMGHSLVSTIVSPVTMGGDGLGG